MDVLLGRLPLQCLRGGKGRIIVLAGKRTADMLQRLLDSAPREGDRFDLHEPIRVVKAFDDALMWRTT